MTARRACDGPSCCSVTEFRDSISLKSLWRSVVPTTSIPSIPLRSTESQFQYPNFRISKCFKMRPLRLSVVPMTVRRGSVVCLNIPEIKSLLKTTKQVVTYLWLVYLLVVIDLLETCDWHTWYTYSLLNCDYWIWIWKLWTVYCELLSWDDFCAGCNLNRFDWYERSTHILASFFLFIMLLVEYRDGLYFVLVSTFV